MTLIWKKIFFLCWEETRSTTFFFLWSGCFFIYPYTRWGPFAFSEVLFFLTVGVIGEEKRKRSNTHSRLISSFPFHLGVARAIFFGWLFIFYLSMNFTMEKERRRRSRRRWVEVKKEKNLDLLTRFFLRSCVVKEMRHSYTDVILLFRRPVHGYSVFINDNRKDIFSFSFKIISFLLTMKQI